MKVVKVRAIANIKAIDFEVNLVNKNCTLTPFYEWKEIHSRTQIARYESGLSLITYCVVFLDRSYGKGLSCDPRCSCSGCCDSRFQNLHMGIDSSGGRTKSSFLDRTTTSNSDAV